MQERTECLPVIISACIIDEQKRTATICFQEREMTAFTQSLTFKAHVDDKAASVFFRNFPVFTREGRLDYSCLEGSRAYLNLIDRGGGWEIVSADYDYFYYGIEPEEDQEDFVGIGEVVYEG